MERVKITALNSKPQEKGVPQQELENLSQISLRTYKYYESGEQILDVHTAQIIAKTLDSKVVQLFKLPRESSSVHNQKMVNSTKILKINWFTSILGKDNV